MKTTMKRKELTNGAHMNQKVGHVVLCDGRIGNHAALLLGQTRDYVANEALLEIGKVAAGLEAAGPHALAHDHICAHVVSTRHRQVDLGELAHRIL